MTKKEIKEICEATFRYIYSFPKGEYKFFDWDIEFNEWYGENLVRVYVVSKRHTVYRCSCWINDNGNVDSEHCRVLA